MDINKYAIDRDASINGTWVDWKDGASVCVRQHSAAGFKRKIEEFTLMDEIAQVQESDKKLDPEREEEIDCQLVAECILVGWKGFKDGDKEIKFSVEKAKEVLLMIPELREFVFAQSMQASNFYKSRGEQAAKN